MEFTPLGFDHIVLQVRDQAAAQKFYTEVLGCTVERSPRFGAYGTGPSFYLRDPDGYRVELKAR